MKFLACRVHHQGEISHQLETMDEEDLSSGSVLVRVYYSSINYKDALAATGRGKIMRRLPLNAGIDLAGVVQESMDSRFKPGDKVLANGCGLGENHDGGLAEFCRLPGDWLISLPDGLTMHEAMLFGTAGFTAALAIHRMENNGQNPEQGAIAVTGASGGVGSLAVAMLAKLGYEVIALSGREEHADYLKMLGAQRVMTAEELALSNSPLGKARFAGAIDNVGGSLLGQLLAHVDLWGNVASIGMADSHTLNASVFPFILRGVSLLGTSSANCPMPLRAEIWQKLATRFRPAQLDEIQQQTIPLADISPYFEQLLDRQHHGRLVVDCQ